VGMKSRKPPVPRCKGSNYHVFALGAAKCSVCNYDRYPQQKKKHVPFAIGDLVAVTVTTGKWVPVHTYEGYFTKWIPGKPDKAFGIVGNIDTTPRRGPMPGAVDAPYLVLMRCRDFSGQEGPAPTRWCSPDVLTLVMRAHELEARLKINKP